MTVDHDSRNLLVVVDDNISRGIRESHKRPRSSDLKEGSIRVQIKEKSALLFQISLNRNSNAQRHKHKCKRPWTLKHKVIL